MAEHDSADPLHDVEAALSAARNERTAVQDALKKDWRAKPRELKAVLSACKNLALKECVVAKKAAALNVKAISLVLEAIKDVITEVCKNSSIFKTTGLGYGSVATIGNVHQSASSCLNGINAFEGAALSDILFPIPLTDLVVLLIVSIVISVLLAVLVILPIPRYAELLAAVFQWAFKNTLLKGVPSLGFVIFSVLLAVGGVNSSVPEQIKDNVTIETVPPSQVKDGTYLRVNSNSTYLFLQSLDSNDTSIKRVPVSQIAYITVNDGERQPGLASPIQALLGRVGTIEEEHKALRQEHERLRSGHRHDAYAAADHEHAAYITEELLRTRIAEEMDCGEDQLVVSKFVRFGQNAATLDSDRKERAREKVAAFVKAWKKQGGDTLPEWTLFGFASADGEREGNDGLARQRATTVKNLLCNILNCDANGMTITVEGLGEDHPINGVANSRSARIAGCVDGAAGQPSHQAETS